MDGQLLHRLTFKLRSIRFISRGQGGSRLVLQDFYLFIVMFGERAILCHQLYLGGEYTLEKYFLIMFG